MPWQKFIRDALILWATIDPISTVVIFRALTKGMAPEARQRVAFRAVLYAGIVLLAAAVLGQFILIGMGISLLSFQVAGGIVLFLFALQLIFGDVAASVAQRGGLGEDVAVYPLAVPSIATPGAILAVILLTDNHLFSIDIQVITVVIAILILFVTYVMARFSERVLMRLSTAGAELIVRVMGLLLAALSVELILDAIGPSLNLG